MDFNHDGEKELLVPGHTNKPTMEIYKIDFGRRTISRLQQRTSAGEMNPVQIGSAAGFGYIVDEFFGDVDGDGVDDFVSHDRRFTDGSNETIETATFSVFKWNGRFFDYSRALSAQLKTRFDPSRDIPEGAWPHQAPLPD